MLHEFIILRQRFWCLSGPRNFPKQRSLEKKTVQTSAPPGVSRKSLDMEETKWKQKFFAISAGRIFLKQPSRVLKFFHQNSKKHLGFFWISSKCKKDLGFSRIAVIGSLKGPGSRESQG